MLRLLLHFLFFSVLFFFFFFFSDFGDSINNCHRAGKEVLTQKHEGSSTYFKIYICQAQQDQHMWCAGMSQVQRLPG